MDLPFRIALTITSATLITCISTQTLADVEFDISGKVGVQLQAFTETGRYADQDYRSNLSALVEPTLTWQWNEGNDAAVFTPFMRLDQRDSERTHGDIRELYWQHVGDEWELKAGLAQVYWGVTEFQHLTDVINQTDSIEDIDGEDKLGQPTINLSLLKDWGVIDLYLLPGFREQSFPSSKGRLRTPIVINSDSSIYESSAEDLHTDIAIRWSHSVDRFDLGAYYFKGTNREPVLDVTIVDTLPTIIPYYEQMDQIGLDIQYTTGSWLLKGEGIWRDTKSQTIRALQIGTEYTLYGIADSASDLGLLVEYGWDSKGESSTRLFQNDVSVGARLSFNDMQSTEILAGATFDLDYDSTSFALEASRRIGNSWKLSIDARFFRSGQENDILYLVDDDSYVSLTLERYF